MLLGPDRPKFWQARFKMIIYSLRHLFRMRIRISAMLIENGSFCCMAKRSSQKRPQDYAET